MTVAAVAIDVTLGEVAASLVLVAVPWLLLLAIW